MVDADVVAAKLGELARRVARVRAKTVPDPAAFAADADAVDVVSLNLMVAVQACADIAAHVIADEGWPPAASVAESFLRLAEHGVVSPETARRLGLAVGLRNVVAHGYERLDLVKLHDAALHGPADLESFAREVAAWVASRARRVEP